MLRMLTAGESHGPGLVGVVEGFPANVPLEVDKINYDLWRRQQGFGRGGRQEIEKDEIEFLSGLRGGRTLGSPLAFLIRNRDYENWRPYMDPWAEVEKGREIRRPRPGHADLSGALKYGFSDVRDVLERSSARETAVRVALGSICAQFLQIFEIEARSHVLAIGSEILQNEDYTFADLKRAEKSPVGALDAETGQRMMRAIAAAAKAGDSLGGVIEVIVQGVPAGLGSYVHWDRKLDARLAFALMSVQGIKGVEIGAGFAGSSRAGSRFHDAIYYTPKKGLHRSSNRAGGIEGGVANGEEIVIRAAMKPIPTLENPLPTVDLETKEPGLAATERSDTCAVPAAAVVLELVTLTVLTDAFLEVYGADSLREIKKRWTN